MGDGGTLNNKNKQKIQDSKRKIVIVRFERRKRTYQNARDVKHDGMR